jgi:imidazolonepropionase-like amidohydrolase
MNPMKALIRFSLVAVLLAGQATAQDLVVNADVIYTGTGEQFEPGVVVIEDGLIRAVGRAGEVDVPASFPSIEAAVATPGLIDARSVVGLAGAMNQPHDQDQLDQAEPVQPALRAIDAYNPRERLVEWLRGHGVTTLHTGHGPGEVISGQTMIAKTHGETLDDALMVPAFGLAASLGESATAMHDRQSPGNRSKAVALLRAALLGAQDSEAKTRDLGREVLQQVLAGDMPLIIEAHQHQDILAALRVADEFDIRVILSGASDAALVIDEIRESGVSVFVHPTMQRARGTGRENSSFTTAKRLLDAGIPVAIQGGYEGYVPKTRVVLFEAAVTLAYGASFDQALALVTRHPAEILGISNKVGTLEPGKHGDLALFDGHPFEYTSHVTGTVIEGEVVSREAH